METKIKQLTFAVQPLILALPKLMADQQLALYTHNSKSFERCISQSSSNTVKDGETKTNLGASLGLDGCFATSRFGNLEVIKGGACWFESGMGCGSMVGSGC